MIDRRTLNNDSTLSSDSRSIPEDEPEKYQTHFSDYIKAGVEPDNLEEELYKKVHAAPTPKKSDKPQPKEHKRYSLKKLTYDEKKQKLIERLNALNAAAGANDVDSDEDDE